MGNPPTPTAADKAAADAAEADEIEAATSPIATSNVDPLHALLNLDLDAADNLTQTLDVPIKDGTVIPWTFGMVTNTQIEEIRDRCTSWVRKPGARREKVQDLDNARFNRELIAEATIIPDLHDKMLVAKFAPAKNAAELLDRFLKPGTITKLGDSVLDFSGFDDNELVAEGKD